VSRVDDLLAAPRGRALCAALSRYADDVFESLGHAVAFAAYWQEPMDADETDVPDEVLRPAAERVLHSAGIDWWRTPLRLDEQWFVGRLHERERAERPVLDRTSAALDVWRTDQASAARSMHGMLDRDDVSGTWWSTPNAHGIPVTSRWLRDRGPAGMWLVEDELGWTGACCWPVAPTREPRVFEVHGPDDWALLARSHPFDVTDSRSPDWRRATGRSGRWVIPDWPAVARDYDAVHVSAWGWLTTAGRPVPVNGAASLLAGWSPDETYWLTDVLAVSGPPVEFEQDEDGGWRPVP
jgi:hypothetical protein